MEASPLALFWAGVIAVAILVYVILDGFDLGGEPAGEHGDEAGREREERTPEEPARRLELAAEPQQISPP